MTDYTDLIHMIETVDPTDEVMLEEIDVRATMFIYDYPYNPCALEIAGNGYRIVHLPRGFARVAELSLSVDECKRKQPEGWSPVFIAVADFGKGNSHIWDFSLQQSNGLDPIIVTGFGRTEPLARLHAVIQAIAYERDGYCTTS